MSDYIEKQTKALMSEVCCTEDQAREFIVESLKETEKLHEPIDTIKKYAEYVDKFKKAGIKMNFENVLCICGIKRMQLDEFYNHFVKHGKTPSLFNQ